MSWFKKRPDPISDKARMLQDEIAAIEAQIQELEHLQASGPKLRAAALPHKASNGSSSEPVPRAPIPAAPGYSSPGARRPSEPIFEEIDQGLLKSRTEPAGSGAHFNELGVRKYDFPALLKRVRNHFRGPAATNPKLVSYLAAGGIQGLRPLRYEKRVARNRFIFLVTGLFLVLLGLIWIFVRNGR